MFSFSKYISMCLIILSLFSCARSLREERQAFILRQYSEEKRQLYSHLLVPPGHYTGNGAEYHEDYYRYLIAAAADLVENWKLEISRESIGFYHDKKSADNESLYLGMDITTKIIPSGNPEEDIRRVINSGLKPLVVTLFSCKTIFDENQVKGIVAGFTWETRSGKQNINIWLNEEDMIKYDRNEITFRELLIISDITDSTGRIIFVQV